MPQTFRQIGVPLVDAFFTLTFVTSIYFLQEFWKTKSIKDIFLFSISAGIFIGTKYLGVPYIFPLALIAIIITWLKFKNKKTFAISTTVMGITTFITGGFFYIRNWLDTGNPLFPVEVNLLGQKIFEGYHGLTEKLINYSLLKNVTSLETFKEFLYGFFLMTGLPSILIFIASISLLGIFIISIIKKKKAQIAITGLAGSLLLFYLFFYFKSPYTYNNLIPNVRYAMMFLLIGCLTVGYVFSNIKKIKPILFPLSMIIFITNLAFLILKTPESIIKNDKILIDYEIFTKYPEILAIALAIMILFIIMLISASLIKKKKYRHIVIGTFISIIILSTFLLQETIPQKEAFTQHYAEFWHESQIHPSNYEILTTSIWLDKAAPKENIAYTGFNFHYHLFGRDLQREVDYININECAECKYFDYKDSPESIRRDPNYENWIKNLESKEKEYLIIAPNATEGVKSWEYEWVEKNPTKFTKVHETKEVKVYKIN